MPYEPEYKVRITGLPNGTFTRIVGRVEKNKKPPMVVDYVDKLPKGMLRMSGAVWDDYQKRMSTKNRWTLVRTETGRIEKNSPEELTTWEQRIKLIMDGHDK